MNGAAQGAVSRFLVLCEVSRTTASHANLPELLHNLAPLLLRVVDFDFLALMLYDAAHNIVQVRALEKVRHGATLPPGAQFPADEWLVGWLERSQQPGVAQDGPRETHSSKAAQIAREYGVESLQMIPLSTANRLCLAILSPEEE